MAPEYAGDGVFSIKSDVYSFSVVVLEIVCGVKNKGDIHKEDWTCKSGLLILNVQNAWRLHNEDQSLQLAPKCLGELMNVSQVLRSIHDGLLCAQRYPEDRLTMTSTIRMLESEGQLPSPKEPGFYVGKSKHDTPFSSSYETNINQ
ncbi:putative protein kinase RLK-Pelle-DLSV family [Helianthus debilis subsp. tardiflorus]